MKKFAQLGDFMIRYIDDKQYPLDDTVGLEPEHPYPQIIYIPDHAHFCCPNNNGKPKWDCTPSNEELKGYKTYSERKLKSLHDQDF
jgi:hypothetical protein